MNSNFEEKGFHLYINAGLAYFNGRIGVGTYLSSGPSSTHINDGRWHHVAGTTNGNIWQVYVDGVLENMTSYNYSTADLTTTTTMSIGNYAAQSGQYFEGEIDEVRVWRTVRSAADIQANMCRKFTTAPADLVAYYNFDQSTGLVATDKGSQPTNGSLTSFTGTPWHLSGAPLGDASTSLYASSWVAGSKVALATTTADSAVVSGLPAQARGVQLYTVNSAPSIAASASAATNYIGVFTAGTSPALGYQLRVRPAGGPNCRSLQQRSANDQSWTNLALTSTTATSLISNNLNYRGEYILVGTMPAAVAVAGDSAVCAGATGQLTATAAGATSYLWSTGATTPVLSGVGPGTYTVTVSFAGGCSGTGQGTIRLARSPVPAISGDSVVCAGATGHLTASATGTVAYRWSTGATTASIAITQGGTYTVTATSGAGCTKTATYRVRVQALVPITITGDSAVCLGATGRLTAVAAGATAYRWNTGAATAVLSGVGPGTYTVTATFAGGCSTTAQATIRQARTAVLVISGDSAVCAGTTGRLQASAVGATTYRWSTGATTPVLSGVGPGTYTVTATFASGCSTTAQGIIRQAKAPVPVISGDSVVCQGTPGRLTASTSGPVTYRWNTGATTASIAVTQGGTYTVAATSGAGCVQTATIVVKVNPLPVANAGAAIAICSGGTGQLGAAAVAGLTYSWSPATGLSSATAANPTVTLTNTTGAATTQTYTLTASNAGSCVGTATVVVTVNPLPVANAGAAVAICSGATGQLGATAVAGATYSWSPTTGLSSATAANPTVTLTNTTGAATTQTYTLTTTSATGCVGIATVVVTTNPVVTPGTVGASQTVCVGTVPAPFTSTTGAGGGTGTYAYQWESSPDNATWTAIANATLAAYTPGPVTAMTYYRRRVTAGACGDAVSNVIQVQIQSLLAAGVSLPTPAAQCAGIAYTFTPVPTNAGTAPTYRWFVNGMLVATSATYTSSTLATGDQVQVELTPTVGFCASGTPTATITVNLIPAVVPTVTMSVKTKLPACAGVPVTFSLDSLANGGPTPQYQWQVNGVDVAGATAATFTTTTLRDGQVVTLTLRANTPCGVVPVVSAPVPVAINPLVHISAGPDKTITEGETVILEGTADGSYPVVWTPTQTLTLFANNPLHPVAAPLVTTTYTLSAGIGDCASQSRVTVTVTPRVRIPNALSPNGDGLDDTWEIDHIGDYPTNHVLVFNRWGSKIFETTNYNRSNEWNGSIGGQPAPLGTYYYVITLGNGKSYSGPLTVVY